MSIVTSIQTCQFLNYKSIAFNFLIKCNVWPEFSFMKKRILPHRLSFFCFMIDCKGLRILSTIEIKSLRLPVSRGLGRYSILECLQPLETCRSRNSPRAESYIYSSTPVFCSQATRPKQKYLNNGNCSSKTVWHSTARHGFGRWIWKDVSSVQDTIADTSKRRSNSLAEISGLQHRKRLNFQNRMQQKWIARNGTFQNRCYIIFGDFGHENEKMRMRKS